MKLLIPFLLFLICCNNKTSTPKYFEGKVVYQNSARSKDSNIKSEDIIRLSGNFSSFYFKNGNYKQLYDAQGLKEELYIQKSNTLYLSSNNTDTFSKHEASIPGDTIEQYILNKNKETILGISCDELIVRDKKKTMTYYFNSDSLKINPEWFSKYTELNKNFTTKKMGALFLKCKIELPELIFEITATKIVHERLDDAIFELPQNAIINDRKAN
jgi:hypothetical protein